MKLWGVKTLFLSISDGSGMWLGGEITSRCRSFLALSPSRKALLRETRGFRYVEQNAQDSTELPPLQYRANFIFCRNKGRCSMHSFCSPSKSVELAFIIPSTLLQRVVTFYDSQRIVGYRKWKSGEEYASFGEETADVDGAG